MLYAMSNTHISVAMVLLLGLLLEISGIGSVGVCNGRIGNNLPVPQEVINLYRTNSITRMRIYDPDPATLEALRGTNIELILGVPNSDLQSLATDASAAYQWVQRNIKAYSPDVRFRYIAVGNEVDPANTDTAQYVPFVCPAMQNIFDGIKSIGLQDQIRISTATYVGILGNSYPPSKSTFRADATTFTDPIIEFIIKNRMPLLVNIYPYFSYISNPQDISLDYALFTAPGAVVTDGPLQYQNLFEAMVDCFYWALEKYGAVNVDIVVSESGWPSEGGLAATIENAGTYYSLLINQVNNVGTAKKPGKSIETYLFAMFDENQKPGAITEQHFGLFFPNQQPKYQLNFS